MLQFIIWTIVLYLLFRFIFNFVLPLVSASRQVRMKMREMQEQMNNRANPGAPVNNSESTSTKSAGSQANKGDYIEFEEVR
jgi:predicted Holliday junction resolvase-like endonuclease